MEIELDSWRGFADALMDELFAKGNILWRGERDPDWDTRLMPSLRRLARTLGREEDYEGFRSTHLSEFIAAARGRRGPNPPQLTTEDEAWALGQHFGLATPLLDWTKSPFAAAYFAFEKRDGPRSGRRPVYALDMDGATKHGVAVFSPFSDENPRLVSQQGWFTITPGDESIETHLCNQCSPHHDRVPLAKILIPDAERVPFLRFLDQMNINGLTLYPDLTGAGSYCNMKRELDTP